MQENYRDLTISYNEYMERFECEIDAGTRYSSSLKNIKAAIDKVLDDEIKFKKKFEKLEVYKEEYGNKRGYKLITITSITDNGECWISSPNSYRKREKMYVSDSANLIVKNEGNIEKMDAIENKNKEIEILKEKINEISKSLERINIKYLQKQIQD